MKHILSPANRALVQRMAWSNVLVAFDFDGTLAPIVADPAAAEMRPQTRRLLGQVARLYPCLIISGRTRADTASRVAGIPVAGVIGNHGCEPAPGAARLARVVARWRPLLAARLAGLRGVVVEDKRLSLAVHYRTARQRPRARALVMAAAAGLGSARVVAGKQVVNLLPVGAPHKGAALERERARLDCDTSLYVGDDDTDEDVFALDQPGRLLAIRVGAARSSHAAYFLRRQREIDALLRLLVRVRAGGAHGRRRVPA